MRIETVGNATLILGDCRQALPTLAYNVVVTDPPWDQAQGIPGSDNPRGLFAAIAGELARARMVCVQLGAYTDPVFCAPLAARLPFFHTCWLQYAIPSFRGRVLVDADVAYVYGTPPASRPGRRVIPAMCMSVSREPHERDLQRRLGRNRTHAAAEARSREMPHPMPRHAKHVRWLVQWHSEDTDVICDPFMGSGTTGVACAKLGRPFVGIEVDPAFYELALERISRAHDQQRLFA